MFLLDLLTKPSAAHDVAILASVIALGLGLGRISFGGIRLGAAGVLFSGILFGHFHLTVSHDILHFIREFGLILFVYSVGMHVGPGFFASLKRQGLALNMMAAGIVLMGVLITIGLIFLAGIPLPAAVGLFSGGTTNTPGLGAAQEAMKSLVAAESDLHQLPGLAYAIAYPFGIVGIILNMIFARLMFRIDPAKEARDYQDEQTAGSSKLCSVNLEVENKNLHGVAIKDIPPGASSGAIISRVMHVEEVKVARPETVLFVGDIIHAVGRQSALKELQMLVGSVTAIDLRKDVDSDINARWIVVTRHDMVGRSVGELSISGFAEIAVTRIRRTGIEFTALPNMELQFGDNVLVVGKESSLKRVAELLGDSPHELGVPLLMPYFVGILLGVVVGSIPFYIPGVPIPVKLGLAGGPLLVAICVSRLGHIGRMIFYMPESANQMMREFGITLFLACVGLTSGAKFFSTLTQGEGLYWMAWAALITFVPLFVTMILARKVFRLNYLTLCGLLSGSMTDPPALAFANAMAKSTATSVAYATVYPLVMILRVICAQLMIILLMKLAG